MNSLNAMQSMDDFRQVAERVDPVTFTLGLAVSWCAAYVAAILYRIYYENRGTGSQVHRAFPLLGISITTLFIGVQVSLPLSLGLLGALSIIRFRTPIKEPEEVGFIMLVIASSVSCATFHFQFLLILYALTILGLVLTQRTKGLSLDRRDGTLVLTLSTQEATAQLERALADLRTRVSRYAVESVAARDGVSSVHVSFSGLKADVTELQAALLRAATLQSVTVWLSRPGGVA